VHNDVTLTNDKRVTRQLVEQIIDDELAKLGSAEEYADAHQLFGEVVLAKDFRRPPHAACIRTDAVMSTDDARGHFCEG